MADSVMGCFEFSTAEKFLFFLLAPIVNRADRKAQHSVQDIAKVGGWLQTGSGGFPSVPLPDSSRALLRPTRSQTAPRGRHHPFRHYCQRTSAAGSSNATQLHTNRATCLSST
jgi:hypothetical protein